MDLLILIFSVAVVGLCYQLSRYILAKRIIRVITELLKTEYNDVFFHKAISIIDKAVSSKWNTKWTYNYLLVNKLCLLFDMGKFQEVVNGEHIETKYLGSPFEEIYFKRIILSFHFLGQTERAKSYSENVSKKSNYDAYWAFFNEDYETSERLLSNSLAKNPEGNNIIDNYLLGIIKYNQKTYKKSKEFFNHVVKMGIGSYFHFKAQEYLDLIENEENNEYKT